MRKPRHRGSKVGYTANPWWSWDSDPGSSAPWPAPEPSPSAAALLRTLSNWGGEVAESSKAGLLTPVRHSGARDKHLPSGNTTGLLSRADGEGKARLVSGRLTWQPWQQDGNKIKAVRPLLVLHCSLECHQPPYCNIDATLEWLSLAKKNQKTTSRKKTYEKVEAAQCLLWCPLLQNLCEQKSGNKAQNPSDEREKTEAV